MTFRAYVERWKYNRTNALRAWELGLLPKDMGSLNDLETVSLREWARRNGLTVKEARRLYDKRRCPMGVVLGKPRFKARKSGGYKWWMHEKRWEELRHALGKSFARLEKYRRAHKDLKYQLERLAEVRHELPRLERKMVREHKEVARLWRFVKEADRARARGVALITEAEFENAAEKVKKVARRRRRHIKDQEEKLRQYVEDERGFWPGPMELKRQAEMNGTPT